MVYSTRRFVLCLTLCYFVLVFFSPFSIAITSLGEETTLVIFVRLFDLRLFGFIYQGHKEEERTNNDREYTCHKPKKVMFPIPQRDNHNARENLSQTIIRQQIRTKHKKYFAESSRKATRRTNNIRATALELSVV